MAQIELGGRLFACPAAGLDSQSAAFLTQLLPGAASLLTPSRLQQLASPQQGCTVDSSAVAGALPAVQSRLQVMQGAIDCHSLRLAAYSTRVRGLSVLKRQHSMQSTCVTALAAITVREPGTENTCMAP
jgi:hypothetical protein